MKQLILLIAATFTLLIAADSAQPSLLQQLKPYLSPKAWITPQPSEINRETLIKSLDAACKYYLAQQRKDGNFIYALDIATGDTASDDNQVRQAGALWGLVRLHQVFPTDDTRKAIIKGMDFFSKNTRQLDSGETVFVYPGDNTVKTGTIALLVLAILDFQNDPALEETLKQHYHRLLFSYIAFLRSMEMKDGSWSRGLELAINFRDPDASPYYDGETLLAYMKAARLLKRKDILFRINDALPKLIQKYTVACWNDSKNDDLTRGFFQWGVMACDQYVTAGWTPHAELAADAAIALAFWQIFSNQLESRKGNTAYAVEGLASAIHISQLTHRQDAFDAIAPVASRTIARLTLCQFQGPLSDLNPHFAALKNPVNAASGGITDTPNSTIVRIDYVQHQVNAILLLLDCLFK